MITGQRVSFIFSNAITPQITNNLMIILPDIQVQVADVSPPHRLLSHVMMRIPCFVSAASRGHPPIRGGVGQRQRAATSTTALSACSTLPTLLASDVKIFDGSDVTNAVVVSNSYWSELSSKLPYLFLANILAAVTFITIASVVTTQGKFILEQVVTSTDSDDETEKRTYNATKFRNANEPPPPSLDLTKLLLCICIDILGSANEAVPLAGELVDVIYAPIAALLLRQLFSGSNIVFLLEFAEEILPFTDVLPLATICWVVESFFGDGRLAQVLGIGQYAPPDGSMEGSQSKYASVNLEKRKKDIIDAEVEGRRNNL